MTGRLAAAFALLLLASFTTLRAASSDARAPQAPGCPVDLAIAAASLTEAYPAMIAAADENAIYWRDGGAVSLLGEVRRDVSFETMLGSASVAEQFLQVYPSGAAPACRHPGEDPGRVRNQDFFIRMYGDCRLAQTRPPHRTVIWLANTAPQPVPITTANALDRTVEALSAEIEALPYAIRRAAVGLAGSFACRPVLGTRQLSMHAYAAAIDLDPQFGRYWRWSGVSGSLSDRDRVAPELIRVFEKYGFIWGGNWYHVDSFHFEYRPELLVYARRLSGARSSASATDNEDVKALCVGGWSRRCE